METVITRAHLYSTKQLYYKKKWVPQSEPIKGWVYCSSFTIFQPTSQFCWGWEAGEHVLCTGLSGGSEINMQQINKMWLEMNWLGAQSSAYCWHWVPLALSVVKVLQRCADAAEEVTVVSSITTCSFLESGRWGTGLASRVEEMVEAFAVVSYPPPWARYSHMSFQCPHWVCFS